MVLMELPKLKESTSPCSDKIPEKILKELADAYGITQVLVDENLRKSIPPSDSVIKVEGEVRLRPKKSINPAMTTGFIEVQARNIEVLGPVSAAVPFLMKDMTPISEQLGLKYRYLHLRRPEFQRNLRFRSTFLLMLRKYLCFVDLETPYLFRRTPGGAKEFIVPSQIRGQFYSLPQSPQQFKQLLMIGCFDRYMQIARCFRDELARPDRQPEFTQLDIEASFVEKDDIYRIVESTLSYAWSALQEFQLDSSPLTIPFQRMSFDEAMRRFGTDKPDTRFGLELWDAENNGTCPHMVCLTVPSLYTSGGRDLLSDSPNRISQEELDRYFISVKGAGVNH
nr:unnamed protein product [Spirometra erinaceieuropaei]